MTGYKLQITIECLQVGCSAARTAQIIDQELGRILDVGSRIFIQIRDPISEIV